MSAYDAMHAALNDGDEDAALRALADDAGLATRRFLGERQCGHSAPLLLHAAELGMARLVKELLALGVPVDTVGGQGATPLHYAASRGHPEAVTALLDAGAPLEHACSSWGNTPLGWASGSDFGTLECVKLLVAAGANPAITSSRGYTPLARARAYELPDHIAYLQGIGAPERLDTAADALPASSGDAMPDGLILHIASVDGVVVDRCGRAAAVEGNVTPVPGRAGGMALAFADGCVRVPHDVAFNAAGGVTVATWLRIPWTATDEEHTILSKGRWERRACPWELGMNPDWQVSFHCYGGLENERCVFGCPRRTEWHHVAGVWDGRSHAIFIDGDEKIRVRVDDDLTDNEVPVTIGRRSDDVDCYRNPLEADLEDVMVFGRGLRAEEIRAVMGQGG